jgi:hypothetical protein
MILGSLFNVPHSVLLDFSPKTAELHAGNRAKIGQRFTLFLFFEIFL